MYVIQSPISSAEIYFFSQNCSELWSNTRNPLDQKLGSEYFDAHIYSMGVDTRHVLKIE